MTIAVLSGMIRPLVEPRLPEWVVPRWFMSREEALELAPQAEIGWFDFAQHAPMAEVVTAATNLKWLNSIYAGLDFLPLDLLAERGVTVTNGAGINAITIAEYVVMLMLAHAKGYREVVRAQERHEWLLDSPGKRELFGERVLLLGLGAIGGLIKARLEPFGMEVVPVRRSAAEGALTPDQWRGQLGNFDWVVLAVPSTPDTHHMIGAEELAGHHRPHQRQRSLCAAGIASRRGRGDRACGVEGGAGVNTQRTKGELAHRQDQIGVIRAQVRSLRRAAEFAHDAFQSRSTNDDIGQLTTAIMLSGLALELGLKTFILRYSTIDSHGHDLVDLFGRLPEQMRNDIISSYEASKFDRPTVISIALRPYPERPTVDIPLPQFDFQTAEGVLRHSARVFEQVRYFFEHVSYEKWAVLSDSTHYMLALSYVLDVVYEAYQDRGGWS